MDIFILIIIVILIAGLITKSFITRRKRDELVFSLYLNMFELYGYYYWLVVSENKQKPEIEVKIIKIVRMITTDMNKIKKLSFAKRLEGLLLSDESKKNASASSRYRELEKILRELEVYINKKHPRVIKRIYDQKFKSEEDMTENAKKRGEIYNAPGFIGWKPQRKR